MLQSSHAFGLSLSAEDDIAMDREFVEEDGSRPTSGPPEELPWPGQIFCHPLRRYGEGLGAGIELCSIRSLFSRSEKISGLCRTVAS